MNHNAANIFGYRKFWAQRLGPARELPMSKAEMANLLLLVEKFGAEHGVHFMDEKDAA